MRLDNYTALITGGASGIGEATVRLFAERGAQVIIADLDEARGKALETELAGKAEFYKVDVSSAAEVEAMFAMVGQKYGVLDVLYNNAAYSLSKTLWDTTEEDWDKVMRSTSRDTSSAPNTRCPCLKRAATAPLCAPAANWGWWAAWRALPTTVPRAASSSLPKALRWSLRPLASG